jgi:hypothetical protein
MKSVEASANTETSTYPNHEDRFAAEHNGDAESLACAA